MVFAFLLVPALLSAVLALATVVPWSKSQSTIKALRTRTTPTNVCHRCTGA